MVNPERYIDNTVCDEGRIYLEITYTLNQNTKLKTLNINTTIYSHETSTDEEYFIGYNGGTTCYENVKRYFPSLSHLPKWSNTNNESPLFYLEDTLYSAFDGDLEGARSSSKWYDANINQLKNKKLLVDRLPKLMKEFKKDVVSLGFTY